MQASSICPLTWVGGDTGHKHSGSKLTGLRFNGMTPEFHCFSTDATEDGKSHDQASFGDVVRHLNKYHEQYPGNIWEPKEGADDDWAEFHENDEPKANLEPIKPERTANIASGKATDEQEKCYRDNCNCGLEHLKSTRSETEAETEADTKSSAPEAEELILLGSRKKQPVYAAVTSMDKVVPKQLQWVWEQRILKGYLNIFGGLPEKGKSLATMDVIATLTTGRNWPDGATNTLGPKTVLLLTSEDGLEDVVWGRLRAAGADLSRVKAIEGVIVGEENKKSKKKRMVAFKEDISALKALVKHISGVALIIVDPISSYYGVDANKAKEVKPVLDELMTMCQDTGIAIVAVAHFNKREDVDALQRVAGDVSIGGSARVMWTFSEDPDVEGEYLMTNTKGNHCRDKTGLRYKTAEVSVRFPDGTSHPYPKMEWLGTTKLKAQDVLDKEREARRNGGQDKKIDIARAWLRARFNDKKQYKCSTLYSEAEAEGINDKMLKRARVDLMKEMNITVDDRRQKGSGYWWVRLDPEERPESELDFDVL